MENLAQYRGTIYDFSDTSKMRGTWHLMFCNAAKADSSTHDEKAIVCGQIRFLCEQFQCLRCKAHFVRYLDVHPPEAVAERKDGLFDWTLEFANSVNRAKNKELYDRAVLYPMFHSAAHLSCDSGCDGSSATAPGTVTIRSRGDGDSGSSLRYDESGRARGHDDVRVTYSEADRRYRRPTYSKMIR